MLLYTLVCIFCVDMFSFLMGIYLGVELLDHKSNSVFKFLRNCQTVLHNGCTISYSYQKCPRVLIIPNPFQHLLSDFDFSHPSGFWFAFPWWVFHTGIFSFFKIYFIDYAITVVPFFPPFIPLCPVPLLPPSFPHLSSCPWVIYKFFGFSISHTVLNLPLSILYLPFLLLFKKFLIFIYFYIFNNIFYLLCY